MTTTTFHFRKILEFSSPSMSLEKIADALVNKFIFVKKLFSSVLPVDKKLHCFLSIIFFSILHSTQFLLNKVAYIFTLVRFTQYVSLFHYILRIFCFPKTQQLIVKIHQCERLLKLDPVSKECIYFYRRGPCCSRERDQFHRGAIK